MKKVTLFLLVLLFSLPVHASIKQIAAGRIAFNIYHAINVRVEDGKTPHKNLEADVKGEGNLTCYIPKKTEFQPECWLDHDPHNFDQRTSNIVMNVLNYNWKGHMQLISQDERLPDSSEYSFEYKFSPNELKISVINPHRFTDLYIKDSITFLSESRIPEYNLGVENYSLKFFCDNWHEKYELSISNITFVRLLRYHEKFSEFYIKIDNETIKPDECNGSILKGEVP